MPAPGKRRNNKAKKPRPEPSSSDSEQVYITEIDNAEAWDAIVGILCNYFQLPDLTKRSGLKRVHLNFDAIYKRIDTFYQSHLDNIKVRGAIVGIYTKMCVDSLLRKKLFDKGVLDKIIPLCQLDETRHLALRALSTITHHGGAAIRADIAKHANALCQLLRDLPDDEKVSELCVSTLSHALVAVAEGDSKPAYPDALKQIDMAAVYKVALENVKRPHDNPRTIIEHTIELIVMSSLHAASAMKAYPSSIGFLVAGLRSKDWVTRCTCLGGLIRLHRLEAEQDQRSLDPQRLMAAVQRGTPKHLSDILMTYGPERSEVYLTMRCMVDYQKAMGQVAQDKDLYKLGLIEARLIVQTEFAILDGTFDTVDPKTDLPIDSDLGLPFKMFSHSLVHGARAIRDAGKPEELDLADILNIKDHIIQGRLESAFSHARKAIERNPDHAYFYYALSLSADNVQGLRNAKKGLKCKTITPFIKYQMMQRAVEHAGDMGIKILQELPEVGDQRWQEGVAFLMSALEDAKAYLDGAPPDNRHMKNVSYWLVLLTILMSEKLNPDLRELQPALLKLKVADEFSQLFGVPPPKTNLRLAQQAAVQHYASGLKEFGHVFDLYDQLKLSGEVPNVKREKAANDLAEWLDDMRLEDGTIQDVVSCTGSGNKHWKSATVDYNDVIMYRCSWCGNPSAALRKCSGCAETRYCDAACQKSHWAGHKKQCKK